MEAQRYFAIPVLGVAGSWRGWLLLVPIALCAIFGVGTTMVGMGKAGLTTLALPLSLPAIPDTSPSPQRKEIGGRRSAPPIFVP